MWALARKIFWNNNPNKDDLYYGIPKYPALTNEQWVNMRRECIKRFGKKK